jgi:hypothetical protein
MPKAKHNVRHVKFTPQEMAYDGPSPAERKKWRFVGRGKDALFRKEPAETTITLAPDVAKVFPSSESVNDALRGLINIAKQSARVGRKIA